MDVLEGWIRFRICSGNILANLLANLLARRLDLQLPKLALRRLRRRLRRPFLAVLAGFHRERIHPDANLVLFPNQTSDCGAVTHALHRGIKRCVLDPAPAVGDASEGPVRERVSRQRLSRRLGVVPGAGVKGPDVPPARAERRGWDEGVAPVGVRPRRFDTVPRLVVLRVVHAVPSHDGRVVVVIELEAGVPGVLPDVLLQPRSTLRRVGVLRQFPSAVPQPLHRLPLPLRALVRQVVGVPRRRVRHRVHVRVLQLPGRLLVAVLSLDTARPRVSHVVRPTPGDPRACAGLPL